MHSKTSRRFTSSTFRRSNLFRRALIRRSVCLLMVMILPIWPGKLALPSSTAKAYSLDFTGAPIGYLPLVLRSLFWLTSSSQGAEDSLADRLSQVAHIRVTPDRFVAYAGQSLIFDAVGTNGAGQTIPGLVFDWESSDSSKVQIDDTGHATFNGPGMTTITCTAGSISTTARVLVRPGRRPIQTDAEWRADQESLPASGTGGVGVLLPSLLDKLAPTAYAQGGGYTAPDFGYDQLWSEPRNLVGSPRNRVIEPTQLGPVLPEGSNFNFSVPLIALGGRGLGANLTMYGNTRVWSRHGSAVTFSAVGGFPFAGLSIGFGRILTYGPSNNTGFIWLDPDGTPHFLGYDTLYGNATLQTTDGTHITFVRSAVYSGTLYYNDGTQVTITDYNNRSLASQIKDSNGNYVEITYKYGAASPLAIDHVTDTQGRQIQFNYDGSGNLISITAPGYGGTAQNPVTRTVAQFDYQSRTLSYNFTGLTVENVPSGAVNVLRHIYFPGTSTGSLFTYSDYGMIYNLSARRQMTIDGSGIISDGVESASVSFNYPTVGSTALTDSPAFTQRTETATGSPSSTYTYSSTTDKVALTTTFTVGRPDSSTLNLTRSIDSSSIANGLLTQTEIKNISGGSMSKTVTAYANDPGGSVQPQSVIAYDDTNTPTKMDFDYDSYGNPTNKREYGFQIGGAWQVRRRSNVTYSTDSNYTSRYLRSLVIEAKVYDALQNTNDADDMLIMKATNTFDDYASGGGMEGYGLAKPPGHDTAVYNTSFTYRGNVTGTTQWIDIASNTTLQPRLKKYDKFGNVLQEMVTCCKQKTYAYVGTDYWANPPTVTDGDAQALHLVGSTTYDFNTGLPKYTEYENMGKRYFYYDAASRLIEKDLPTGDTEIASYNDSAMTASLTKSGLGTTTNTFDGLGRVIQTVDASNTQVNIGYDAMGRVVSRTNPFTAGGSPGPSTAYGYDALGRVTVVTLPDSQTIQTAYSGATVTAADQVNRTIKRESDGLGRPVKVTEQDSSGNLTQDTNYSYNLIDKLTLVNQGNQTRAFSYDALGRMLYERIPEQTATINDGSGTYWTTKYTYTDFSAVATKTDARGVITTYSYDTMNRPLSIIYNTWSAPGVAATPSVGYVYDNDNNSPTNGVLLAAGIESYSYDSYRRLSSITRTIDSFTYATSYQYGTGSLRSQITYPGSGRVLNISRDSSGRVSSLADQYRTYINNIVRNPAGQMTALSLGNVATEAYGYDANRLQLTSQSATAVGGPANGLMNLTYSYQASAGQMGAGTTAGNAGQLMSISGTINSTTESAAYTYDDLGRLTTSNQTSNGSSAQRRLGYDRWGNRTGMWDATSGGSQIQSIALQQSGGAPTNQIASVIVGLNVKTYAYDYAGNVTNDGVHTYQYDAENRLTSVDGGATATYGYDQHNRRIKKIVGSTITHYVWEAGQVLAEHDGTTGSVIYNYVYSGDRLIARMGSGVINWYLNDRLSERLVLDANANVIGRMAHLPFGEDFGESGTQEEHHFTNYERDGEAATDYALNREYSQAVGRFMHPDRYGPSMKSPLVLGSFGDPQGLNRYGYARNDPIDAKDPHGLAFCFGFWVYYENILLGFTVTGCTPGEDTKGIGGGGATNGDPGTGGGGQGSGPGAAARTRLSDFLKKFQKCSQKLETLTRSATGFSPEELASDVSFRSYESYGLFATFRSEGLVGRTNAVASTQIRVLLGPLSPSGSRLGAWTSPISPVVILGASYFSSGVDRQGAIVAHEMLHIANPNLTHQALAGMLGVDYEQGPNPGATEDAANKALTDWIEKGCQDPPDKK